MGTGETTKEQHEGDFLNHGAVLCHNCEGGDTNLCNKTHRTVQQNKMSFVVYKLKTNNQKQNLEGRLWGHFIYLVPSCNSGRLCELQ